MEAEILSSGVRQSGNPRAHRRVNCNHLVSLISVVFGCVDIYHAGSRVQKTWSKEKHVRVPKKRVSRVGKGRRRKQWMSPQGVD